MLIFTHQNDPAAHRKVAKELLATLGLKDTDDKFMWPPPNLVQIRATEFWAWRHNFSFLAEANVGAMALEPGRKKANVLLFYANNFVLIDGGFAVAQFDDHVNYYEWLKCDHEFDSAYHGAMREKNTCKKCKKSYISVTDTVRGIGF